MSDRPPSPSVAPRDDRLGRRERLAGRESPGEGLGLDADPDPRRVEGVHLGLGEEVARVDEAEPVGLALRLVGRRPAERDERVVLRARRAARARDGLPARDQRPLRTCASRAHAPVSPIITQSASGRSSDALIAVRTSTGAVPVARIVALRAMASWIAEEREPEVHLDARHSSPSVTVSVSASPSCST